MYDAGHIKNAININAFDEDAAKELGRHKDKKQLLVYCTMQNRSKTLIKKLKELNYSGEIIFITNGMKGWKKNNYELDTEPQKQQFVSAAEQSKPFEKLKPIVQVFGTGTYDVGNKHFGYSFGRAHLGFQYTFNEAWSGIVIIDRGSLPR